MKVNKVQSAAKDYPAYGISVGDTYYWWKHRNRPKQMSKTYPRQSQLTTSDKLQAIYWEQESIRDVQNGFTEDTMENVLDALNNAAATVREVGEEYGQSADNMEEYFPNSSQVDEIREKADSCEEIADALEQAANDVQQIIDDEEMDTEGKLEEIGSILEGIDWGVF